MNSAYSISETPKTHGDSGVSNPVLLEGIRMAKVIIHHILSLHTTPPKYRRPPKVDRGCFEGYCTALTDELWHAQRAKAKPLDDVTESGHGIGDDHPVLAVTFKATSQGECFSQFDSNSGCFDGDLPQTCQRVICLRTRKGKSASPASTYESWCERMTVTTKGITFKAAWGTQTRHGGSVVKYQPCSQI